MMESIFFNPWIWIIPIILLIAIAGIGFGLILEFVYADDGGVVLAIFGGLLVLVLGPIYFGLVLPPYDGSFYQTYRVTGAVDSIEAALTDGDGVMAKSFVVEVAGIEYQIMSTDQRFRTITVGDEVTLACTKQFQYFVEPWLECSMGGRN